MGSNTSEYGRGLARRGKGEESYRHCQETAAHGPACRIGPGLAAAVLLVSEASKYRPALHRALTGGNGEGENDDGGGGEGMGGEGGSSSLSSSYFDPSKRDQNILLDLAFLRR